MKITTIIYPGSHLGKKGELKVVGTSWQDQGVFWKNRLDQLVDSRGAEETLAKLFEGFLVLLGEMYSSLRDQSLYRNQSD